MSRDGGGGCEAFVPQIVRGVDVFFVELGEQDVGDGVDDGFWRAFEQVGEADVDLAFAEADGGVEGSEAAEADRDGRHGRAWAEGAVFFLEDGGEVGGHGYSLQGSVVGEQAKGSGQYFGTCP